MTSIKTLTAVAAGALALAAGSPALARTVPSQTPYGQSQTQTDPIGAILGALFGDRLGVSTSLDSEWARGRRPLNAQRAQFEARLDADVQSRALSSSAANSLRSEYGDLVQLEARYTADGRVTTQERTDLSERYRAFATRYQSGGSNGSGYGDDDWRSLADGRADFEARVDASLRSRTISRTEATRLRTDYQALIQVETGYDRDGLSAREEQDLRARLDALNQRVGDDYDNGAGSDGGYGSNPFARQIQDIGARIDSGERSGQIARAEVERLRTELGDLTRLDAAYRENDLNADERTYLTRRFGELDARIRVRR